MRLADYVFDLLAREGVKDVFLLPGGGAMHLVDAVGKHPLLRYVAQHHEQACGIAAEANGRIRGAVGVALVTTGPGATNILTPVAGAWIESTPLLVLSGQVKRGDLMAGRKLRQHGVQEVDVVAMVTPITKYAVTIMDPTSIRYHLEKALHLARTGRQGPVWLDIPLDVQGAVVAPDELRGFSAAVEAPPAPDRPKLEALVTGLQKAERPLLLLGHGVRLAGAQGLLGDLLDVLPVPVVTTWNALDLLPFDHELLVGRPGAVALRAPNFAVQNSDLLLAIGARLDNVVTAYNPAQFARSASKWVVDIDAEELKRHELPSAQLYEADAARFIGSLTDALRAAHLAPKLDWQARCRDWKARYGMCDGRPFPEGETMSHFHAVELLSEALPERAVVVTGSSGLAVEAFYTGFRNKPGQRVFLTSGLGAMGYGLPAAIGACLASSERTFLVESDGSMQLNLQELATLKALDLPLVIIVLNNGGYASIRNTQRNYFNGRYVGTGAEAGLFLPDLVMLAQVYGIAAARATNAKEFKAAFALATSEQRPFLLDLRLVENEVLWPRVASQPEPDGSMTTMPIEDMTPLLPIETLRREMLIPLHPASLSVRGLQPSVRRT